MNNTKIATFKKGETIIREGDIADKAYIVKKGHVEVYKNPSKNERVLISTIGPNQIFGELSLFGNLERSATVIAINDVELEVIDKSIFIEEVENTSPLIKLIIYALSDRLRKTSDKYSFTSIIKLPIDKLYR